MKEEGGGEKNHKVNQPAKKNTEYEKKKAYKQNKILFVETHTLLQPALYSIFCYYARNYILISKKLFKTHSSRNFVKVLYISILSPKRKRKMKKERCSSSRCVCVPLPLSSATVRHAL